MDKEMSIKEKIARWKILADLLIKSNKKIYIKDVSDNYYFANVLIVGEDIISIDCFAPEDRIGKQELYWVNITKLEEYKEVTK